MQGARNRPAVTLPTPPASPSAAVRPRPVTDRSRHSRRIPRYSSSHSAAGRAALAPAGSTLRRGGWRTVVDQPELAAPVAAMLAALATRTRSLMASTLAESIRLTVPSLNVTCAGRDQVLDAIGAVLLAFPDFAYRLRSRYVAPNQVTDEVLLEGTQSGPLLGAPASGRAGTVAARILITHDGVAVTSITLWVDAGALRDLVDIPEATAGTSSPVVTALRASMTPAEGRVIMAQVRDATEVPRDVMAPQTPLAALPPPPKGSARGATKGSPRGRTKGSPRGRTKGSARGGRTRGSDLKVPVPRRVRQTQGIALALAMIAISLALVTWVIRGTVRTTVNTPPPRPTATTTSRTVSTASAADQHDLSPTVPLKFNVRRNEYELASDLLFASGSFTLTPAARQALDKVMARVRSERRWGTIIVTGYTDGRGSSDFNLALSRQRATAVASALQHGLADRRSEVTVIAEGRGEANPVAKESSDAGRAANRRVTVQLPKKPTS